MDAVLGAWDEYLLAPYLYSFFPDAWIFQKGSVARDMIGLYIVLSVGGALMYLSFATLSYIFVFDKALEKDKRILVNQKRKEIAVSLISIPIMAIIALPVFLGEVYGYSRLYDNIEDHGGIPFVLFSIVSFLLFTDFGIYWIHRGLHYGWFYAHIHKPHHWWKIPTPFASHAFHPLDGFAQSFPYHVYAYLFPIHKWVFLGLFLFVNFWTISIHDGDYRVPQLLSQFINGAAHHTVHHLAFTKNYGQFFTLWDKIGGSHLNPGEFIVQPKKEM